MDESFLPYAMLRPLIRKGMTARDLSCLLEQRLGIDSGLYGAVCMAPGATLAEALRGGIRIVKRTSAEFLAGRKYPADEPVR